MKRLTVLVSALIFGLCVSGMSAYAQGKGQNRGPGGHPGARVENPNQGRPIDKDAREDRREDRQENRQDRFEDRIERNPELRDRVRELLPPGTDARAAASGFKNQGQFIAALHVSKNLNIPFDQLKARMTGSDSMSLGKAIHDLRPDMPENQAKREAERAEKAAKETAKTKRTT